MKSGSYPCEILTRSSEDPVVSSSLSYTVRVYLPGSTQDFEGVKPQSYDRDYYAGLGVLLVPFDIGMRLSCTVINDGGNTSFDLSRGEIPAAKPCGAP